MRKFFRFVVMAMILVTVALMSALTAMRVAIHGRETTVPNFVNLSTAEAKKVAGNNGLSVGFEGQFYSADVMEGHIVSQIPAPGTRVRRGWRVRLAESLGPQRVVIPDVTGESARAAELNIRQRGLELGSVAEVQLPGVPTQEIVAQSPPPNAQGVQSPKVSLLMAAEPAPEFYVMPNFAGQTLSDAVTQIEQAGFKVGRVSRAALPATSAGPPQDDPSSTVTTVVHQSPAAGQKISTETQIELEVGH